MRQNRITHPRKQRCAESKLQAEQPVAERTSRRRVARVTASNIVARALCALTILVAGTVGYATYASVTGPADPIPEPRPTQESAYFLELQFDEGISLASEAVLFDSEQADSEQEPLAASFVVPGWATGSVAAVLLLAGFNARKRRGHLDSAVSDDTPAVIGG